MAQEKYIQTDIISYYSENSTSQIELEAHISKLKVQNILTSFIIFICCVKDVKAEALEKIKILNKDKIARFFLEKTSNIVLTNKPEIKGFGVKTNITKTFENQVFYRKLLEILIQEPQGLNSINFEFDKKKLLNINSMLLIRNNNYPILCLDKPLSQNHFNKNVLSLKEVVYRYLEMLISSDIQLHQVIIFISFVTCVLYLFRKGYITLKELLKLLNLRLQQLLGLLKLYLINLYLFLKETYRKIKKNKSVQFLFALLISMYLIFYYRIKELLISKKLKNNQVIKILPVTTNNWELETYYSELSKNFNWEDLHEQIIKFHTRILKAVNKINQLTTKEECVFFIKRWILPNKKILKSIMKQLTFARKLVKISKEDPDYNLLMKIFLINHNMNEIPAKDIVEDTYKNMVDFANDFTEVTRIYFDLTENKKN